MNILDKLFITEHLRCLKMWQYTLNKGTHNDKICIKELNQTLESYLKLKEKLNL